MPTGRKVCNFECVYCECGWTHPSSKGQLPTAEEVENELRQRLQELRTDDHLPEYISFAGNGEPTLHPAFEEIVGRTIGVRTECSPTSKIAVLSNATRLRHESVRRALMDVDERILKLDAGTESMFVRLDKPDKGITLDQITEDLVSLGGDLILQSMFHGGHHEGECVDNTEGSEIRAWLDRVKRIRPKLVMIYTLDRTPPAEGLVKISKSALDSIAQLVREAGVPAEAYG